MAAVGLGALSWRSLAQAPVSQEARASQCLSRLRETSRALSLYARDHGERLPPADRWNDALAPRVRTPRVFDCPSLGAGGWGYSMNWKLSKRAVSEADSPSTTVLLYETNVPRPNAAYDGGDWIARHARLVQKRREAGGNYAFADGSVKWIEAGRRPNFRIFLEGRPGRR